MHVDTSHKFSWVNFSWIPLDREKCGKKIPAMQYIVQILYTGVFTIITTKDQSGGIYTGDQRFMAVVNKPRPRAMPSDSAYTTLTTE